MKELENLVKLETNTNINTNVAIVYKDERNIAKILAHSNNYPKNIFIDPFKRNVAKNELIKKEGVKSHLYYFIANDFDFADWGLIVSVDANELLKIQMEQKKYLITILSIAGILTLLASIFLSKAIIESISNMTSIASLISSGNYKKRIEYMGRDELGDLAIAINKMVDSFLDVNGKLEREISDKTKDLMKAKEALNSANQERDSFSSRDELTNLYNKSFFNVAIKQEWNKCTRNKSNISLLILKIDLFQEYKNALGYKAASACILELSKLLSGAACRSGDIVCKYNDIDEFIIIVNGANEEKMKLLVEKVLNNLREKKILHPNSYISKYITFSPGYATITPKMNDQVKDLIYIAEAALKKSIDSGGDQAIKANL